MNTKRFFFWASFIVVLILIVWGLIAAMNKPAPGTSLGEPAPVTAADNAKGPVGAKVMFIEYGDFQCPACAIYAPIVERLYTEASTTVRIVFRHFPLSQHKNAMISALAAEAAAGQGRFWEMYDLIYAGQEAWSLVSEADASKIFAGYAVDLGLDVAKFTQDLSSTAAKDKIRGQLEEGTRLGVNATPTFFVNGEVVVNPRGYAELKAVIDAAAR